MLIAFRPTLSQPPSAAPKDATPTEALIMPVADLLPSLAIGNQFDGNGHVEVDLNNGQRKLSYDVRKPLGTTFGIPGQMDGEKFTLNGKVDMEAMTLQITGDSKAGPYQASMRPGPGDFAVEGKLGNVEFKEQLEIGFDGLNISGEVGGQKYELKSGEDGTSYTGKLGDKAITAKVEQGPNGTILIHEQIGDDRIEEIISR